jgi:hypothetical protein
MYTIQYKVGGGGGVLALDDNVNSDIGLSNRLASPWSLAGRDDIHMPVLILFPSQGSMNSATGPPPPFHRCIYFPMGTLWIATGAWSPPFGADPWM